MKGWFEVDKAGLAMLMERRGMAFVALEAIQNAWDEQGVQNVSVTLEPVDGRRMACLLRVEDDSPDGFRDLADAWTLFAESYKKGNPDQRGRFNLGEKLVLAVCREATVSSTTGGVRFDDDGRHRLRGKRERGTVFEADVRMTRDQCADALAVLQQLLPPPGVRTVVNGQVLPAREPMHSFRCVLQTEAGDEDGVLRRLRRTTDVHVHEPRPGEEPTLYEMGIPIQPTGDRWHVDVRQCVPLTLERDSVPSAYMARLRAEVVNAMHDRLTEQDASEAWVREATSHPQASPDAVRKALDLRFGDRRVMLDPSDPESNRRAQAAGFTVVHPRQLSTGERGNIKRIDRDSGTKMVLPAGRVFPTHGGFVGPGGEAVRTLAEDQWTPHHWRVVRLAHAVALHTLDLSVVVRIVHDEGGGYSACYARGGRGSLTFNAAALRAPWWAGDDAAAWDRHARLVLHELAHQIESNHLSDEYHRATCLLGARLAWAVAARTVDPLGLGYSLGD